MHLPGGHAQPDGVMSEPKPGVAMLATRSGVPILPVGVSGTDKFLGRGVRFPRIGTRLTVRVGQPFTVGLDPIAAAPRADTRRVGRDHARHRRARPTSATAAATQRNRQRNRLKLSRPRLYSSRNPGR